jgi:hypothetical protein
MVAGIVALLIGWFGVSDATLPTQQISYLASGGLFGLFLLGAAATLWLSADLRDEWRKLDDIHQAVTHQPSPSVAESDRANDVTGEFAREFNP